MKNHKGRSKVPEDIGNDKTDDQMVKFTVEFQMHKNRYAELKKLEHDMLGIGLPVFHTTSFYTMLLYEGQERLTTLRNLFIEDKIRENASNSKDEKSRTVNNRYEIGVKGYPVEFEKVMDQKDRKQLPERFQYLLEKWRLDSKYKEAQVGLCLYDTVGEVLSYLYVEDSLNRNLLLEKAKDLPSYFDMKKLDLARNFWDTGLVRSSKDQGKTFGVDLHYREDSYNHLMQFKNMLHKEGYIKHGNDREFARFCLVLAKIVMERFLFRFDSNHKTSARSPDTGTSVQQ